MCLLMGGDNRKSRSKRRPKRKGNQHTRENINTVVADDREIPSPSQPKVTTVSSSKLSGKIQKIAPAESMMLKLFEENRYGLACELKLKCCNSKCYWEHVFYNTKKTQRAYQINRRAFYSIRKIGGGYQSLRKFLCLMNHPPPMTEKNYKKNTKMFCDKIKGVAETLTQEASVELHGTTPPDQIVDVGITIDGTWQKRGFKRGSNFNRYRSNY